MSAVVPPSHIEEIVGVKRSLDSHYGSAMLEEERFYILHSKNCRDNTNDLRTCPYSIALDAGIDDGKLLSGEPLLLDITDGRLQSFQPTEPFDMTERLREIK